MGALVPLGKVANARAQWLWNVLLYTLAGAATSALAGLALGAAGQRLPAGPLRRLGVPVLLGVVALLVCRELSWLHFPLPQPRRQTEDLWAKRLRPAAAATLWGLDLGLTVTTRFTFSGTWALILLPVLLADARLGAAALLAFWLGRALPVWIGPLLLDDAVSEACLLDGIGDRRRGFQRAHVLGLLLIAVSLLVPS